MRLSLDWQSEAACKDAPTDLFFPIESSDKAAAPAQAICARCPVSEQCRAEFPNEPEGIWWGTTPKERDRERRRKREGRPPLTPRVCANRRCEITFKPIRDRQLCCTKECGRALAADSLRSPWNYGRTEGVA